MKVLFCTWAWPSHLYALVPLAWACRARGHDVVVAGQPALLDEIARTGLPGTAVGTDVDSVELVRGYVLPSAADGPPPAGPPVGGGPRALRMVLDNAESMTADLVDLVRDERVDLVVHDPTAMAGPIAAAAAGVPAVRHLYGTDLLLRARGPLTEALAPLAARHGAGGFDPFGAATVDPTPTGLQVPTDYRRLPMRHVPYNGSSRGPRTAGSPGRPRVCVTWGHTMARLGPDRFLGARTAAALAGAGAQVVLAVSEAQLPLLDGVVPEEVEVVVDTALDRVLPGCDLVVSHGGAGTVLTALAHGLPLLLVPQLPDHAGHARRVAEVGAGEVLTRDEATPERLLEATRRLLPEDGPARAAARKLQAEMAAQPSPAEVAEQLEGYPGGRAGHL
ncbi:MULTISPECIES: nucleotide disphospho-sugar-binding domain-containing protein [unclassified Streptomyces]|uniref:nucleotide disphospho-sugar-binding domain-containing protein n=1 Tax=unclassified Streptomyces TaxID=2593676 RepID=UPI002476C005|nr:MULTISPECIES: nucleotide disphospho-sugar-binding domain-containing protein [unclassified Streptomyces]MDH6453708.1 UDP:flavonoid glycosyltransferase YjiC (YdhE family) [Streptomyces sp. SAI-119]MDH6495734.1 UDP:flavonoid glycosyltransferase YjiC (YdhE family) [Streptomyces sp. SAI-149]